MPQKEKRRKFSFLVTALVGSSVSHLTKTLARHSLDYKYTLRVAITFIVVLILEPFRWWEEVRWKCRIKNTDITTQPVFIIGFWRSGTTLLHTLMCQDPKAAYVTTYQTVFPHHILSHSWWFKPIIGQFWPTHRPFDDVKMGLDLPQEEEIALASLQAISFYNFLYFPKDFEKFYEQELFLKGQDKDLTVKWKKVYLKLIKKSIINTKRERFISKNPSNMARIGHLLKMFPDAKFVFIYRDPYKTVESFYRFFDEVIPAVQIQASNSGLDMERHVKVYTDMIRHYFENKNLIPPSNLVEVRYEDFRKDPMTGLGHIYSSLGLSGFDMARPYFEKYLKEISEYHQHSWEITPETIELVNRNAGDIVERLGYQRRA
jgi:hypothetical protein